MEKWFASGRGICCREVGHPLATMPATVQWLEDTTRIVDLLNKGERFEALVRAATDCGTDADNPDTCGVCHLHFAECEADERAVGDNVDDRDVPVGREPACPGARLRAALKMDRLANPRK